MHEGGPYRLHDGEVHVWRIALDASPLTVTAAQLFLSDDERERALRLRHHEDRTRWITCRATLRLILSRYVGLAPEQLCFSFNGNAKPDLSEQLGEDACNFNMSRSGEFAICAIARGRRVGVDLERIQDEVPYADIARERFADEEVAMLNSLPMDDQRGAFFQMWTYKEAYVKACGIGFHLAIDRFAILPASPGCAVLSRADGDAHAERWLLRALALPSGYRGALAVEGPADFVSGEDRNRTYQSPCGDQLVLKTS
jgi:4'-phosphopantetheinyl transferase